MSLKKKDSSASGGLRVAANDPHLVSLGGGRLSTAVTIHYIPIGSMTIGSSSDCTVSLNGSGVQSHHCTLNRSKSGDIVTIIPENNARVLIDGNKITNETNLTQGAMLTIGNSNYLRFNNPAEAQMIKSTMGSNERISMPQIDFTQSANDTNTSQHRQSADSTISTTSTNFSISSKGGLLNNALKSLSKSYDTHINQNKANHNETISIFDKVTKIEYINMNNFHSPKVFTADSITVNAPAKDVLGSKYASFAKNLVTNHKNDKHFANSTKNNEFVNNFNTTSAAATTTVQHETMSNRPGNYVNIPPPSNFIHNNSASTATATTISPPMSAAINNEVLAKVNNNSSNSSFCYTPSPPRNQLQPISAAYDRYPKKLGGGLQVFPMNCINSDLTGRSNCYECRCDQQQSQNHLHSHQQKLMTAQEQEKVEEILKICSEYDRQQNQSSTPNSVHSSPIVQNRIKTNGSLPREKKSPFFDTSNKAFFPSPSSSISSTPPSSHLQFHHHHPGSGYENVRLTGDRRVEIGNNNSSSPSFHHKTPVSGYENVIIGKYIPQSPRTKIRTTCTSPQRKDIPINLQNHPLAMSSPPQNYYHNSSTTSNGTNNHSQSNEYAHLIQTFEDKLKMEMKAIQEIKEKQSTRSSSLSPISSKTHYQSPNYNNSQSIASDSLKKRQNLNINNLTLNLNSSNNHTDMNNSQQHSTTMNGNCTNNYVNDCNDDSSLSMAAKTSANSMENKNESKFESLIEIDDGNIKELVELKKDRETVLEKIRKLKTQISDIQQQEDEVLREMNMEKALVSAEMSTVNGNLEEMQKNFKTLQAKVHRLEAQRNANRVMQETQQAKLKQSIEVKQDQVITLETMLKDDETNETLKEEYKKCLESLENDRKLFEDLEFQYLEEETDWMAYREELHTELKNLTKEIEDKQQQMLTLQVQGIETQNSACTDTKSLETNLLTLLKELEKNREELKKIDKIIQERTGDNNEYENCGNGQDSLDDDDELTNHKKVITNGLMSQSLFGSTEILSAKPKEQINNLMTRSINENMFFNNKIEMPSAQNLNSDSINDTNENLGKATTSTPKKELKVFEISENYEVEGNKVNSLKKQHSTGSGSSVNKEFEIIPEIVKREHNTDEKDPILKLKYNVQKEVQNDDENDNQISSLNLSLESDDFEVNPLEKRIPSQDDIDRICKVTLDAPISTTKGASTKIIESIKEIERNRQLLLAQQGSHVIEHERQKMLELKKKSHDEARAQYLSSHNISQQSSLDNKPKADDNDSSSSNKEKFVENSIKSSETHSSKETDQKQTSQQRHSHPELESQRLRTNSDTNYETKYYKEKQFKSNNDLTSSTLGIAEQSNTSAINRYIENAGSSSGDKRSSLSSNHIILDDDGRPLNAITSTHHNNYYHNQYISNNIIVNSHSKRTAVPKHQRPLTRYLPIMSPDLDLRQHIESAGHQIALCPHVIIDSYSCRGYLHKLGATFHGWSRRWFVLDRQKNAFIYYSDRSERKPRGGAYFSTIDEVYLDHLNTSKSGRPHCTFIVKTKKRSYHLQAASDAAARIWIDAIITGAQGNIDY